MFAHVVWYFATHHYLQKPTTNAGHVVFLHNYIGSVALWPTNKYDIHVTEVKFVSCQKQIFQ